MFEKLYPNYRKWPLKECIAQEGIVVASDLSQEWILPWWISHYQKHNAYPIAFVDFGMSQEMKKWCANQGELILLPIADIFVCDKTDMDPALADALEEAHGNQFWLLRNAWFKKPLACLQTPFLKSLWIDIDCQVRGPLKPIFDQFGENLAIARDLIEIRKEALSSKDIPVYNSGVLGFKRGLEVVQIWADRCFEKNHEFRGDQDILNAILQEKNTPIREISPLYNWSRCSQDNPEAVVIHWHGPQGKATIAHQIAASTLTSLRLFDSNP
jgi:hypothetical protein